MNLMDTLPTRMDRVQSPVIPIVGQLIRTNPGTLSLGQGVVYYGPPDTVKTEIETFWKDPKLHEYQSVMGIPPLRKRIWEKLEKDNRVVRTGEMEMMVTAGGNMAFSHAIHAITRPGDQVILPVPYYFNHEMAIAIAGCQAKTVATDKQYQLRLEALEKAITTRTRAIVTVSPNNPTGVIYPEASLMAVNDLCRRYGLYHIHDEAYEYFSYGTARPVSPAAFPGSAGHTLSLYSLSKSFGFASWRIGYLLFPAHLHEAMRKIQDTHLICPSVIAQYGAIAAMKAGKRYPMQHMPEIQGAREIFLKGLEEVSDLVEVPAAQGAFYFLLKVKTQMPAMEIVERLITEHKVAVIPGDTFGIKRGTYLRIAYGALQKGQAEVGIQRFVNGLRSILG